MQIVLVAPAGAGIVVVLGKGSLTVTPPVVVNHFAPRTTQGAKPAPCGQTLVVNNMNTTTPSVTPATATVTPAVKTRKPRKAAKKVETKPATKKLVGILRKSKMAGPVSKVHEFLDTHPKLKRSEAISALVKRGVAFYTARTQYQVWFSDRKAAAKARKGKAKAKPVAKVAPVAATGT